MGVLLPADIAAALESAIAGGPPDRRIRILSRMIELLVAGRDHLRDEAIGVLDEVLNRLSQDSEVAALAQLSAALADLSIVPRETARHLAFHSEAMVAAPLLLKLEAISPLDLETIATSRGEQHLLAIAGRRKVERALADILLRRGGKNVCRALAENPGARFSEAAYAVLLARAEGDDVIANALALRPDAPATARKAKAPRPPIQATSPQQSSSIDYAEARSEIAALARIGKLNDSTVNRFAIRGDRASLVVSLSVLSGAPIDIVERVMADPGYEDLVMACRASRLNWQTTLAILGNRGVPPLSSGDRARAQELFDTQHLSTSQWTVRWGDVATGNEAVSTKGNAARSGAKR
jgi:uncharacterized protein (DUF2336 family)